MTILIFRLKNWQSQSKSAMTCIWMVINLIYWFNWQQSGAGDDERIAIGSVFISTKYDRNRHNSVNEFHYILFSFDIIAQGHRLSAFSSRNRDETENEWQFYANLVAYFIAFPMHCTQWNAFFISFMFAVALLCSNSKWTEPISILFCSVLLFHVTVFGIP